MDKEEVIRVLALPVDFGGCGWYRVRQPLSILKNETPHDSHVIDNAKDDPEHLVEAFRAADTVVTRSGAEKGLSLLKEKPEYQHLKWVMDIDDNIGVTPEK